MCIYIQRKFKNTQQMFFKNRKSCSVNRTMTKTVKVYQRNQKIIKSKKSVNKKKIKKRIYIYIYIYIYRYIYNLKSVSNNRKYILNNKEMLIENSKNNF